MFNHLFQILYAVAWGNMEAHPILAGLAGNAAMFVLHHFIQHNDK